MDYDLLLLFNVFNDVYIGVYSLYLKLCELMLILLILNCGEIKNGLCGCV